LQQDLGHMNDVRTAHDLVEEVTRQVQVGGAEIGRAGGIVLGWHDRGLADHEPRVRRDVSRLKRAKRFWPRVGPMEAQASQTKDQSAANPPQVGAERTILDAIVAQLPQEDVRSQMEAEPARHAPTSMIMHKTSFP